MRNGLSSVASIAVPSAGASPAAVGSTGAGVASANAGVGGTTGTGSGVPAQGFRITSHATPTAVMTPPATQRRRSLWRDELLVCVGLIASHPQALHVFELREDAVDDSAAAGLRGCIDFVAFHEVRVFQQHPVMLQRC